MSLRTLLAVIGPPRSLTKMYDELGHSRIRRRSARSSSAWTGWVVPRLARLTCSRPLVKSTCSQRKATSSETRNPCR